MEAPLMEQDSRTAHPKFNIQIGQMPEAGLRQALYAMHFCDPRIMSFRIDGEQLTIEYIEDDQTEESTVQAISRKATRLFERYRQSELEHSEAILGKTSHSAGELSERYDELVRAGLVVPLGLGRVSVRGWFAALMEAVDMEALRRVAVPLGAKRENYPAAITLSDLAKTQHVASFPEHLHFVSHLTGDLDKIDEVGRLAREGAEWKQVVEQIHHSTDAPALCLNPSVCYQCFIARRNSSVGQEGTVVTARSRCHRWEGGAMTGLRRLMDFEMREVIMIGHPEWVQGRRERAEKALLAWAQDWGLEASIVNANDPFFTDDFEVKAAFQRRQDMKHELVMPLADGSKMAVSSSNFHSVTFGKAFEIKRGGRPACSGCIGWGLERWAYAIVLQHGMEPAQWPAPIRDAVNLAS